MKVKILVTLVVLAVALGTVASLGQVAGPTVTFSMKLDPALLEQAAGLNVYELGPPTVNADALPGLRQRLFGDIKGEQVQAGEMLALADAARPSNFLMLNQRTGYFSFDRGLADQIDEKPGNLPSTEAAQKIALDFFGELKLLPAIETELVFNRTSRIFSAAYDPRTGLQGKALPQVLVVYFARQFDGVRVLGPGSKLIARLGDGGAVVGGSLRWRPAINPKSAKGLGLRTATQVQRDISAFLLREQNQATSINVDRLGLCYFDQDGKYIQPVIGYEATIKSGRNLTERYFGQTPLLLRPVESVVPAAVTPAMLDAVRRAPQRTTTQPVADAGRGD